MILIYTVGILIAILTTLLVVNIIEKKELEKIKELEYAEKRRENFNRMKQARDTKNNLGDLIKNNTLQLITGEIIMVEGTEIFGDRLFIIKNVEYELTKSVDLTTKEDKYTLEELKEYDWVIKELYEEAQRLNEEISKVFNNKYIKRKDGLNG